MINIMGVPITRINGKIKNDINFKCKACGVKYPSIEELGATSIGNSGYREYICEYCHTGKPKKQEEKTDLGAKFTKLANEQDN